MRPWSGALPVANIDEVAGDSRRGGHRRANQVGPAALALPTLKVAVRRARAAFAGLQDVGVHAQAHAAASLTPFEASVGEHAVEALLLGGHFDLVRTRNDHGSNSRVNTLAADHVGSGAQVFEAGVGARANENPIE